MSVQNSSRTVSRGGKASGGKPSGPRSEKASGGKPYPGELTTESVVWEAASRVKNRGIFKVETEGVGKTIPVAELEAAPTGGWLPGFEPPDFSSPEFAEFEDLDSSNVLPAWMGSYDNAQAEFVHGVDTRQLISGAMLNQFPFNVICRLLITAKNGQRYLGTGWLGGNRILYTAGHCTCVRNAGGLASRITIFPPGGAAIEASNWGCTDEWSQTGSQVDDMGCIFINQPIPGRGWLGFDHPYNTDSQLLQLKLHVMGYPGDKPTGTMWGDSNQLTRVYDRQLKYAIDTMGGQSGAAVMTSTGEVVGIHNYGANDGNLCSRINPDVKAILHSWWKLSGSTN